ncbi:hypothetical protein A0H81_02415 [Grifola frondosa]|uniref:Uncharacterized protein n=1 Tax=Grifola frondosa TaxID=5627 RepID=A0A1C7MLK2_GRIFR|nr:hypothetical protein A0H81_02415 [Grifola frondosa]
MMPHGDSPWLTVAPVVAHYQVQLLACQLATCLRSSTITPGGGRLAHTPDATYILIMMTSSAVQTVRNRQRLSCQQQF